MAREGHHRRSIAGSRTTVKEMLSYLSARPSVRSATDIARKDGLVGTASWEKVGRNQGLMLFTCGDSLAKVPASYLKCCEHHPTLGSITVFPKTQDISSAAMSFPRSLKWFDDCLLRNRPSTGTASVRIVVSSHFIIKTSYQESSPPATPGAIADANPPKGPLATSRHRKRQRQCWRHYFQPHAPR